MKRKLLVLTISIITLTFLMGCGISNNQPAYQSMDKMMNSIVIESNTEFAFDIFRELTIEDADENVFISPFSILTALTMAYQGAEGPTKDEMAEALRYDGIEILELNKDFNTILKYLNNLDRKIDLNINNSIWIRDGEKVKEDFIGVNKSAFNAEVNELDFSKHNSADIINQWIDGATKGKILRMIEPPIGPDVFMYLINAIYFKGEWSEQFDKDHTQKSKFFLNDGREIDVNMMIRTGNIEYGVGDNFTVVRLPYGNGKTSMYTILPNKGIPMEEFINSLNSYKWNEIKQSLSMKEDLMVQIPRFKIEYGIKDLKNSLSNLGMKEAFTDYADFSGIRENTSISRVLHKAVIEVNEEGSEAAAVTVAEVKTTAYMEPLTFTANRPFVFVISEDELGTILFTGKVNNIE